MSLSSEKIVSRLSRPAKKNKVKHLSGRRLRLNEREFIVESCMIQILKMSIAEKLNPLLKNNPRRKSILFNLYHDRQIPKGCKIPGHVYDRVCEIISHWKKLSRNRIRRQEHSYSPYWVAKCLRVDVSVVYHVMQQYARCGSIRFKADKLVRIKKSPSRSSYEGDQAGCNLYAGEQGDPSCEITRKNAGKHYPCGTGQCKMSAEKQTTPNPLADTDCVQSAAEIYAAKKCETRNFYFRDEFSDCPPANANFKSVREIAFGYTKRSSINLARWIINEDLPVHIASIRNEYGSDFLFFKR